MRPVSDVAVDLGTATTQVFAGGEIVADDLTLVARKRGNKVVGIGRQACDAVLDDPKKVRLASPLRSGAIDDPDLAAQFMTASLRPLSNGRMGKLDVLATVPSCATPIERRVMREAARRGGASTVHLIEHPIAVALGADLPVHEPDVTCVLDLGAGVIECALISLGTVMTSTNHRSGSGQVDLSIKSLLRREYGLDISDVAAEQIKFTASTVVADSDAMVEASGLTSLDGSQATAILEVAELHVMLDEYFGHVHDVVRRCLSGVQPEVARDVMTRGIHLAGAPAGSARLASSLAKQFEIPVHVVSEPRLAGVNGAGKCLEALDSLGDLFLAER